MPMNRRGFTLAELLIAMVVTAIVGLALTRLLTSSQRVATTQVEVALMQSMMRQGSNVLVSELQEIGADTLGTADIIAMTDSTITYRAMGVMGQACDVTNADVEIVTGRIFGSTGIVAGRDSMLLFIEGEPDIISDDRWAAYPITAVAAGGTCPGGASSMSLITSILPADLADVVVQAPIRIFTPMQFGVATSGGQRYLGLRQMLPSGSPMQPLAGPISGQGVRFDYYDSTGAVTTTKARVRAIRVAVYGQSDRAVRAAPQAGAVAVDTDSLVTFVSLRNTQRY